MIDWDNWDTSNGQIYFNFLGWFFNSEIEWKELEEKE